MTVVSHSKKFIFICNGKTGTTSIQNVLEKYNEMPDIDNGYPNLWANKHIPPAVLKSFLPTSIWDDYFKFVFVRHPLDWFISQYSFQTIPSDDGIPNPPIVKTFTVKEVDFFYEYLRPYRGIPDAPTLYQTTYVCDVDGNTIVDFIGHFENLAEDFNKIKAQIDCDVDLPHLNPTNHPTYQECFTPEAMYRIRELWAKDFENFGYEIPN